MQSQKSISFIKILQSYLRCRRQFPLQWNLLVFYYYEAVLSIDEDMQGLMSGMGIVLHRILHEYLYRHRENEVSIVV